MEINFKYGSPFPSWTTYDHVLNQWLPPVPYPTDGKSYIWDEPTVSWVETS